MSVEISSESRVSLIPPPLGSLEDFAFILPAATPAATAEVKCGIKPPFFCSGNRTKWMEKIEHFRHFPTRTRSNARSTNVSLTYYFYFTSLMWCCEGESRRGWMDGCSIWCSLVQRSVFSQEEALACSFMCSDHPPVLEIYQVRNVSTLGLLHPLAFATGEVQAGFYLNSSVLLAAQVPSAAVFFSLDIRELWALSGLTPSIIKGT